MAVEPGADHIIARLGLAPHPEGGHYRETWRAHAPPGERAAGTAIYYLLKKRETSRWHRVDSAEIWHFYAGAPLELTVSEDGEKSARHILGADLAQDQTPQVIVAPNAWQTAKSLGEWTLVGCTVSPGFDFEHFQLAPAGWQPGRGAY